MTGRGRAPWEKGRSSASRMPVWPGDRDTPDRSRARYDSRDINNILMAAGRSKVPLPVGPSGPSTAGSEARGDRAPPGGSPTDFGVSPRARAGPRERLAAPRAWLRAARRRVGATIIVGHLIPGGRLVPIQGVGVGRVGVDADARFWEVDLFFQLDGQGSPRRGRISWARRRVKAPWLSA